MKYDNHSNNEIEMQQNHDTQNSEEIKLLETNIKKLEEKCKAQEQSIVYLKADIENIKKNTFKEIQQSTLRSNIKTIGLFLSVLDDYELSMKYAEHNKEVFEGLLITHKHFLKILKELEVEEIKTDSEFNPEFHEAISSCANELKEKNSIEQVIQKGYMYKKQILRPAKVIVVS